MVLVDIPVACDGGLAKTEGLVVDERFVRSDKVSGSVGTSLPCAFSRSSWALIASASAFVLAVRTLLRGFPLESFPM